jgi:predicted RNA-binding protein Jag
MNYEIVDITQDVSNKYVTRVIVDQNTRETMFFYFGAYPSQEHVNAVVGDFLLSLTQNQPQVLTVEQQVALLNPSIKGVRVSARQIRLWLVQHGVQLDAIENAISSIEDPLIRQSVKIEWEYAPYVERNHPWLVPLAESLGLTPEQVDQAFIEASTI